MSGKIAAAPHDLARESIRLRDAAAEVESIARTLRLPLPAMPAAVRGRIEGELGWALVALSQISGALLDEAGGVARRRRLFEQAGEGGFSAALGGYLNAIDHATDPWLDGLERVLVAPRYVRFGTWVHAYTYVNKYGTVVNVDKHWRDLPDKLMKERPVFAGIGEDSALVKGVKIAGRAGIVLTFVSGGLGEWEEDKNLPTAERAAKSVVVGGSEAGGAWAGAWGGAEVGGTIGGFAGPEGAVVGGVVGGLVGGFAGSQLGHSLGHAISSLL